MAQNDNVAVKIGPISPAGSGPLYQQIVAGFKREIGDNRLSEGAPLPSFRLMAKQLLVSGHHRQTRLRSCGLAAFLLLPTMEEDKA